MTINVYISYDYELIWGVWDMTPPAYVARNVAHANQAATQLIELHRELDIPATFAIVGAMLEDHPAGEQAITNSGRTPAQAALFTSLLENYEAGHVSNVTQDNLTMLDSNPIFEIGSHSYAHIYALESSFDDLARDFGRFADRYRESFGRAAQSLVMPKNEVSPDVHKLATANGFQTVRMNPPTMLYSPIKWGSVARKIVRLLRFVDSFLPLLEMTRAQNLRDRTQNGVRVLIGQYFVRSYISRGWMFSWHLARLKLGLRLARLRGHSAHYWCHPHNFGADPVRSLANHARLLRWLKSEEQAGRIRMLRMSDTE